MKITGWMLSSVVGFIVALIVVFIAPEYGFSAKNITVLAIVAAATTSSAISLVIIPKLLEYLQKD